MAGLNDLRIDGEANSSEVLDEEFSWIGVVWADAPRVLLLRPGAPRAMLNTTATGIARRGSIVPQDPRPVGRYRWRVEYRVLCMPVG